MPTVLCITFGECITPFSQLVSSYNPDMWYRFNEASGNIINQGSMANADLVPEDGPGQYAAAGITGSGGAFEFQGDNISGGGRFLASSYNQGTDFTSVGSIFTAFKTNLDSTGNLWSFWQGFDQWEVSFQLNPISGIRLFTSGPGFDNDALATWASGAVDNDWHTALLVRPAGLSTTAEPILYYDGVATSPDIVSVIPGGNIGTWIDDFGNDLTFGSRGNPDTSRFYNGFVDEMFVLGSTALDASQALALHNSFMDQAP